MSPTLPVVPDNPDFGSGSWNDGKLKTHLLSVDRTELKARSEWEVHFDGSLVVVWGTVQFSASRRGEVMNRGGGERNHVNLVPDSTIYSQCLFPINPITFWQITVCDTDKEWSWCGSNLEVKKV